MGSDFRQPVAPAARQQMGLVAFSALIGAALMLYVGFGRNLRGISDSNLYNLSVDAFTWAMKIGGCLMAAMAVLLWAGWRHSLVADAVLAAAIGAVMLMCGGIWMMHSDLQGMLLIIFAMLFLNSAKGSWEGHRAMMESVASTGFEVLPAGSGGRDMPAVDADQKQEAMRRLLESKRSEPPAARPLHESAAAVESPKPAADTKSPAARASVPSALAEQKVEPKSSVPAPEGFLASLGQDDEEHTGDHH
jgi:hypothetical protein